METNATTIKLVQIRIEWITCNPIWCTYQLFTENQICRSRFTYTPHVSARNTRERGVRTREKGIKRGAAESAMRVA